MMIPKCLALSLGFLLFALPTRAQEESKKFPNEHLLVSTDWAVRNAAKDGVRLVDVRSSKDYGKGHLPGAVNVPTDATFRREGPRMMLGPREQIAKLFGAAGVDRATHVVLYDQGRSTAAARVFWTLETYGHTKVSVLDGGFAKWKAEKRQVTTTKPDLAPKTFETRAPSEILSTLDIVMEDVEAEDAVMLDSRTRGEYDRGRLPEAVRIEWVENFTTGDAPVFKSPAELEKLYAERGVTPDKRVHCY